MMLEAVRSRAVRPPRVREKLRRHPEEILAASQRVRREHGLLVGDSLLLAVMRAEGLRTLGTHDADLRRIEEIAVAVPADL